MATTTAGNLLDLIAIYLGRTAVSDLAINVGNTINVGYFGLNAARRKAERIADFRYAEINAALSIAATTGTAISAATGLGTGATIKTVLGVDLPIAGGDYVPCEFLTEREWEARVRRQTGRSVYSAGATLAGLGVSNGNPIAYQQGQLIHLVPESQFGFPVAARLRVIRFMPDYSVVGDTDFFTQWAPEYLQWQALLEINKHFRRFVVKNEGNIDEAAIKATADEALQTLLAWNSSLDEGTSTPPAKG